MSTQESFDIVQAKLSGIYCTSSIEVPFETYDRFIQTFARALHENGLNMEVNELMEHPQVLATFDKILTEAFVEAANTSKFYHDIGYTAYTMFKNEIETAAEEKQSAMRALMQEMTGQGTIIPVDPKNYSKALSILRIAGLIDDELVNDSEKCNEADKIKSNSWYSHKPMLGSGIRGSTVTALPAAPAPHAQPTVVISKGK